MIEYTPWVDGAGGVRMGLQPIALTDWLRTPADAPARLAERQSLVRTRLWEVWARMPGAHVDAALMETASLVAGQLDAGGSTAPAADAGTPGALAATPGLPTALPASDARLLAAGLRVCEDLCVLLPEDGEFRLQAALLCAPSFWRLREKLGHPLPSIHAPVAGLEEKLGERIRAFLHNLPPDRVFTRGNWHLHTTGTRYHPMPDDWTQAHTLSATSIGERLWVRCERQTLRRLPTSGGLLFTILVYVQPLAALAHAPVLAQALWDAYLGMPVGEREARHFNEVAAPLRAWIDALPSPASPDPGPAPARARPADP